MTPDETLYQAFLEELHTLEEFRLTYALEHPHAGYERDDPDVKRLFEVLAFMNARTRLAALRNVEGTRRRLFQQFFPYLLSPLPAMGMVRAAPNGHLTEALELPAGTQLAFQPDQGNLALFRTTRTLRVLPIRLTDIKQDAVAGGGARVLLQFDAAFPLNERPGPLSLHVNYLNDFGISLKVFHFLERHLRRAHVQFGEYAATESGQLCAFRLGTGHRETEAPEASHPLEIERLYFHYPQQELFLDLDLPDGPRNWTRFTVALDFDAPWPRLFKLNRELFQLFVAPAANTLRAFAEPIVCDGTQERYSIRHPHVELGCTLQKVLGVYEITEAGMQPLRPGILANRSGAYEIERGPGLPNGGHRFWLTPHFPEAFAAPRTLAIDAVWLQPTADLVLQRVHTVQPYHRQTVGLHWEFLDAPCSHAENRQLDNTGGYLHLINLMHKPCFSRQDLDDLLSALGSLADSRFAALHRELKAVYLDEQPLNGSASAQLRQTYRLVFGSYAQNHSHLMDTFVRHVSNILDHWIADAAVGARGEILEATPMSAGGLH